MSDPRETLDQLITQGQNKGFIPQKGKVEQYPELAITEEHGKLLLASGISQEVAEARQYFSVLKGEFFRTEMAIPSWERLAPCLTIPVWDVTGNAAQCQIRPDSPRVIKDKPVKYESLPSSALRLDIPPAVISRLNNPKIPLYITEGSRKADAAVSQGAAAISVMGVWGFRGKNAKGGKSILVDWEYVALNERITYIAFDSDSVTKSSVATALQRLKQFLESRGAKVKIVYLQPNEDGSKVGLDDFLAQHPISELADFTQEKDTETRSADISYGIVDGRYVIRKGENVDPICNFVAKIELEEIQDDGLIEVPYYHISGETSEHRHLPTVSIPVEEFQRMEWVEKEWRTRVQVGAGRGHREHLAAAIKAHSQNAPIKQTFTHTGWREIEGQMVYLFSDGHVPEDTGIIVDVTLEGTLVDVRLEKENESDPSIEFVMDSFLNLCNPDLIVPLLASVFTAPLGEFITLDFAMQLVGPTGTFKTEIASLMQGFWGRNFHSRKLPANWSSTGFALEKQTHSAKDMIYVVDDYAPQPSRQAGDSLAQKAEILVRGAGNQAGRARLSSDIKLRPQYFARGLILSTGEEQFSGQSLLARTVTLFNSDPKRIKTNVLSDLQALRDRGVFSRILYRYIAWLSKEYAEGTFDPQGIYEKHRTRLLGLLDVHKRNISANAKLLTGMELFARFSGLEKWNKITADTFSGILLIQKEVQQEESLVERALESIKAALASGSAYMEVLDDTGDNERRHRYGYRVIDGNLLHLGTCIGYVDTKGREHLLPKVVFDLCWRFIVRTPQAITSALAASDWLKLGTTSGTTSIIRVNGASIRVLSLSKPLFDTSIGSNLTMDWDIKDLKP